MKKIITIIVLLNKIYATDDLNQTSLDMFLFKIGFQTLVGDLKKEQQLTQQNRQFIRSLEIKINSMIDINKKNINNSKIFLEKNIDKIKNDKIQTLEKQLIKLQERLDNFITKKKDVLKKDKKIYSKKIAKLMVDEANIYQQTNYNSPILRKIKKDDKVYIEYCNKFDWCKLKDEDGYIAKFKLNFNIQEGLDNAI